MRRLSATGRHELHLTVNGRPRRVTAESRMLLSDLLRHELGLTGTHVGCEHGVCGACTVRIDGVAARACLTLAAQVDGARIETVESLAPAPTGCRCCRPRSGAITRCNAASAVRAS